MATRQHSRFVHFTLPWLVAAVGLAVFLVTLHPWVNFDSVTVVARIAGWDWNTMQLGPVTLLVTWPFRYLPPAWQPLALNAFSAACAALTLGLLAKSVALLPHDRTREQRQRERSDFSFLSLPLAWLPPVAAASLLGLQLTFWEHATAMTGEMLQLTLFAFCVYCFLRFRVQQEDRYLAWLSFAFGAAAANDWGIIAFCPLFFIAIVWAKGIAFFDARFLIRTTAAGLAGTCFYLVLPIALLASGQAEGSLFDLLRTQLSYQRQVLLSFPRWALLFCGITSVLPVFFMGIRWPATFGDLSAAGSALTNFLFRLIHAAFFACCLWTLFDPPFSPRERGFGMPFLHFYFLTALSVGYFAGYLLLVLGQEPERRIKRISEGLLALSRTAAALVTVAALAAVAGLAYRNAPTLRAKNGPLVRELAATLLPPPGGPTALISDDPILLQLAVGLLHTDHPERLDSFLPISSSDLRLHPYQALMSDRYQERWPSLALERLPKPLSDDVLLQQIVALNASNTLYYAHPSFGFYFEAFHLQPAAGVYRMERYPAGQLPSLPPQDASFHATHQIWSDILQRLVDDPVLLRYRDLRVRDAEPLAIHYSRALNYWGVLLQRQGNASEASRFFKAASTLSTDNIAATINHQYSERLQAGNPEPLQLAKELTDQLGRHRDLPSFLMLCGPIDEPGFRQRIGQVFFDGNLHRQAAQQFARIVELLPQDTHAHLWLASASLNSGLFALTLDTLHNLAATAPQLTPSQSTDLASLEAWATFRLGDLPAAVVILESAQNQFPQRLEPLQTLNDIYLAANDTNAALTTVERLISRSPKDLRPLITKSAIQLQIGAVSNAVQTLTSVLESDPSFFPALVNRALAYTMLGRLDDAERDYRQLLQSQPKLNIVHYHLAELDFQRSKADSARSHYLKFLERAVPGSPEARLSQQRLESIANGKLGG
jgi:tetratricopeptide (TPR) repeat protein